MHAFCSAVFVLLIALPALAGQSEHLAYDMRIGGLHVADILVELDESDSGYRTQMTMETRGMARWFRDFRAELNGRGTMTRATSTGLTPVPARFHRSWDAGDVAATLTIGYDPASRLAEQSERLFNPQTDKALTYEELGWYEDDGPPPPVPPGLRTDVFDPMAAFVAARRQILDTNKETFRLPIYDGRRRYDLVGLVEPPRDFWIDNQDMELVPVVATVEPVFGFDDRRAELIREGNGKVLFTPDGRFIPVQIVISGTRMTGVMNLKADCAVDAATCQQIAQAQDETE